MRGPLGSLICAAQQELIAKALPPSLFAKQWRIHTHCMPHASRSLWVIRPNIFAQLIVGKAFTALVEATCKIRIDGSFCGIAIRSDSESICSDIGTVSVRMLNLAKTVI
jgi:hypothetical protein